MAPPDDSSTPWRLGTPHDSLNRFTSLLGTFVLKESDVNEESFAQKALVPKHDAMMKLLTNEANDDPSFSFPCLSLISEEDTAIGGLERSEVQAKAATFMGRSMRDTKIPCELSSRLFSSTENHVESSAGQQNVPADGACQSATAPMTPSQVPTAMLHNLAASFALLVDARLRAYTTILARHGVALAVSPEGLHKQEAICAVERKLDSLMDIASRISFENMVTSFQPQSKLGMSRCVDNVDEIMMPLIMSAVIDISVPRERNGHERVTVTLQASGAIVGCCDKGSTLLKWVRMELDTQQLMTAMVHKAAKVSSVALDHVNDSSCRHVAAAMLSLKTALPEKRPFPSDDRILPVVSPDHCMAMLPPKGPTPLTLDQDEENEDDEGPELTPECCASIVDDCFGGIKDDSLVLSPPTKRMRMENAPAVPPTIL